MSTGSGGSPTASTLVTGWDSDREVVDELGPGAHERRVVVGVRVVLAEDEAFEVVHVGVEPIGHRPRHDVARDVCGERQVDQQLAEAA